jgi:hypothetical protein
MRVRSRAGADDALMRGMCASATRSLCKAIHRWNTHIYSVCIPNACMYLYPYASSYTDERIADAGPPHTRAHVLRPCARARACAIGRARIRAHTCERVPSAWTAGGSARSCSARRRRSTRTSARGAPRVSRRWTMYAPPFRPGGPPANAYVMYNIYVDRYRCKVRVCKWVRNFVLACACDRVRALTMR